MSDGFTMNHYAAGAAAGGVIGAISSAQDIRSQGKMTRASLKSSHEAWKTGFSIAEQQKDMIEEELGSVLSSVQLEGLKAMASYRAMSAERGVGGAAISEGKSEIAMSEVMARADAINQSKNMKVEILNRQLQDKVQTRLDQQAILAGISSPLSAGLKTLATSAQMASNFGFIAGNFGGQDSGN